MFNNPYITFNSYDPSIVSVTEYGPGRKSLYTLHKNVRKNWKQMPTAIKAGATESTRYWCSVSKSWKKVGVGR